MNWSRPFKGFASPGGTKILSKIHRVEAQRVSQFRPNIRHTHINKEAPTTLWAMAIHKTRRQPFRLSY